MSARLTVAQVEAVDRINAIDPADPEMAHAEADKALLELVHPEVRLAYERLVSAAPWWGSA